ncbi:hypothetical protein [Desulfobacula sp.]|jgi:hypothetical protein
MKIERKTRLIVFMVVLLIMGIFPNQGSASLDVILLKGQKGSSL